MKINNKRNTSATDVHLLESKYTKPFAHFKKTSCREKSTIFIAVSFWCILKMHHLIFVFSKLNKIAVRTETVLSQPINKTGL